MSSERFKGTPKRAALALRFSSSAAAEFSNTIFPGCDAASAGASCTTSYSWYVTSGTANWNEGRVEQETHTFSFEGASSASLKAFPSVTVSDGVGPAASVPFLIASSSRSIKTALSPPVSRLRDCNSSRSSCWKTHSTHLKEPAPESTIKVEADCSHELTCTFNFFTSSIVKVIVHPECWIP